MTIPDFLHLLRRRALLILSVTLICGVISLAVTAFILPHEYTAYATFCVRNRSDYGDGITSADLAACESLTEPCIAFDYGFGNDGACGPGTGRNVGCRAPGNA